MIMISGLRYFHHMFSYDLFSPTSSQFVYWNRLSTTRIELIDTSCSTVCRTCMIHDSTNASFHKSHHQATTAVQHRTMTAFTVPSYPQQEQDKRTSMMNHIMMSMDSNMLPANPQQASSSSSSSSSPTRALGSLFRPKTKSVRFAKKPTIVVENPLLLSEEDCRNLWYSLHDLSSTAMRTNNSEQQQEPEVEGEIHPLDKKNQPLELQKESRSSAGEASSSCCTSSESNKRRYHRRLTIQCIRSACRKGMSEEKLAEISRRCSAGSVQLAALQAIHDFVAVHHSECPPGTFADLPPVSSIQPTFPFSMRKRQRVVQQHDEHPTMTHPTGSSSRSTLPGTRPFESSQRASPMETECLSCRGPRC